MPEEPLQRRKIANALAGQQVGSEVQVHEEVVSTNDTVRALGLGGFPHGLVVLSESQTGGRGRRGSRWESPPQKSLLLSILLRPSSEREDWVKINPLTALAISRAIASTAGIEPEIKWPNDVFIGGKKVAGILAETVTSGQAGAFIVLGMGINVNTHSEEFPPELRGEATSIVSQLSDSDENTRLDRNEFAIALLRHLNTLLPLAGAGFTSVFEEMRDRSMLLGKAVKLEIEGEEITGLAEDFTEMGHLILRLPDGSVRVCSGANLVRLV